MPWFVFWCAVSLLPGVLPGSYYRSRVPARARRFYKSVGIRTFKKFVVNGDWVNHCVRRHASASRMIRTRDELEGFRERTRNVEQSHLVLLLLTLFSAVYAARLGWYRWGLLLTFGNVACNLYPIFLQRYNRSRIP